MHLSATFAFNHGHQSNTNRGDSSSDTSTISQKSEEITVNCVEPEMIKDLLQI